MGRLLPSFVLSSIIHIFRLKIVIGNVNGFWLEKLPASTCIESASNEGILGNLVSCAKVCKEKNCPALSFVSNNGTCFTTDDLSFTPCTDNSFDTYKTNLINQQTTREATPTTTETSMNSEPTPNTILNPATQETTAITATTTKTAATETSGVSTVITTATETTIPPTTPTTILATALISTTHPSPTQTIAPLATQTATLAAAPETTTLASTTNAQPVIRNLGLNASIAGNSLPADSSNALEVIDNVTLCTTSFFTTGSKPAHVIIDLGKNYAVLSFKVISKSVTESENLSLRVSTNSSGFSDVSTLCVTRNGDPSSLVETFTCPAPMFGRYIKLEWNPGKGTTRSSVCELEVNGY